MKKGEVWSIDLPSSSRSEQMGSMPSVIKTEADANIAIIIPFSSNVQALRYTNTIFVELSVQNGLKSDSIILVFQIRAIDKHRILNKLGELEEEYITKVDKMLMDMLKLSK